MRSWLRSVLWIAILSLAILNVLTNSDVLRPEFVN
jgi:hypothetical protein